MAVPTENAYINALDNQGKPVLHYATSNLELTQKLLRNGADPLMLNDLDKLDKEVQEFLLNYNYKLLTCMLQSYPLQDLYYELHNKGSHLSIYQPIERQELVADINFGFQLIYKVVNSQTWCRYCLQCDVKTMRCFECKTAYYCSKECQQSDWHKHRKVCNIYQKIK